MEENTRVTRTPRLLAVAVLASLALSGCGGLGPSGAAATVGDTEISTSDLQDLVDRSLADPAAADSVGADKVAFQRNALRRLISHVLVETAAEREGVTADGAAVDATLDRFAENAGGIDALTQQAVRSGVAKADLRQAVSDVTLRDLVADKLTADVDVPEAQLQKAFTDNAARYDRVRSAHILVGSKAKANQLLAALKADPSRFAELAKANSTDTGSKDNGGDLGFQPRGALEKAFEDAIFDNPPGSLVIAKTQYGYHVINVIERKTTTFEQARPELRRQLLESQRTEAVDGLLADVAEDLGVEVNPRFGAWDPASQQVVAVDSSDVVEPSPRPGDPAEETPAPQQ